jgi:hypothetical protein
MLTTGMDCRAACTTGTKVALFLHQKYSLHAAKLSSVELADSIVDHQDLLFSAAMFVVLPSPILAGGATVTAGWVYVAFRALYPFLAVNKGIGAAGAKPPILIATVPAYGALVAMASPVIRAVFF